MTRAEAAAFVGVSVSTIRRWETTGVYRRWDKEPTVLQDRTVVGLVNFVRYTRRYGKTMNREVIVLAFARELLHVARHRPGELKT